MYKFSMPSTLWFLITSPADDNHVYDHDKRMMAEATQVGDDGKQSIISLLYEDGRTEEVKEDEFNLRFHFVPNAY